MTSTALESERQCCFATFTMLSQSVVDLFKRKVPQNTLYCEPQIFLFSIMFLVQSENVCQIDIAI